MRPTWAKSARRDQRPGREVHVDAYPGDLFEGQIYQIRNNSTTTQNVVTYPVVIEAPNPGRELMPGMTASISFPIDEKENVLRVPAAALRFVPLPAQVRPEDRHYLEGLPTNKPEAVSIRSAAEKAAGSEQTPTSRRLGPRGGVVAGRSRHPWPDRQSSLGNSSTGDSRRASRRDRNGNRPWRRGNIRGLYRPDFYSLCGRSPRTSCAPG